MTWFIMFAVTATAVVTAVRLHRENRRLVNRVDSLETSCSLYEEHHDKLVFLEAEQRAARRKTEEELADLKESMRKIFEEAWGVKLP